MARSHCSASVMSVLTVTARPPAATTSAATSSRVDWRRAVSTTAAPWAARESAAWRPSPGPTPETTATRSASSAPPPLPPPCVSSCPTGSSSAPGRHSTDGPPRRRRGGLRSGPIRWPLVASALLRRGTRTPTREGVAMLFVHEVHQVAGAQEEAFDAAYREGYLPTLAQTSEARLLWYLRL